MSNRLRLDWSLNSSSERNEFASRYLAQLTFAPSDEELETISNYILWGKDPDGTSAVQKGEFQIETRNKTWQRDDTDSLDAMLETPTFNEATIRHPSEARIKTTREAFDRQKAFAECPPHLIPVFEDLFKRIDTIDLGINLYEFEHGRRKEPPRASLVNRFSQEEYDKIAQMASKWNQFKYLKQRHQLVELRREQFTLRDTYHDKVTRHTPIEPEIDSRAIDIDAEIPVYPLGLVNCPMGALLFREKEKLYPKAYTEEEQTKIIKFLWQKKSEVRPALFFDFGDLEHVYELFRQLNEMETNIDELPIDSNLRQLIDTLKYYVELADLTDVQKEVLDLKIQKVKNQEIADYVNKKYNKSYTANYISTIFRQKIIPKINEGVNFHALILENICFEENFKKCSSCGRILLIDAENFVRKARAKDGFSSQCKICDKRSRQFKKSQR